MQERPEQPQDALLEAEARGLDRTLRALAEPAMRRERLLRRLEEASPAEAYGLIAAILERPGRRAPHLLTLREVLQGLLREGGATRRLDYEFCARIYSEAAARDDDFVMRLFRTAPAAEVMNDPAADLPRDVAEIPLGMRRALARGGELALLERLLLDPDATVIEHLLANPRITEPHVVRIAARRPIPASTLSCIERSRRFGQRTAVRVAVARNPYCPTPLALKLLGALPLSEIRGIARDATLHEALRAHARAELERRRQPEGN